MKVLLAIGIFVLVLVLIVGGFLLSGLIAWAIANLLAQAFGIAWLAWNYWQGLIFAIALWFVGSAFRVSK